MPVRCDDAGPRTQTQARLQSFLARCSVTFRKHSESSSGSFLRRSVCFCKKVCNYKTKVLRRVDRSTASLVMFNTTRCEATLPAGCAAHRKTKNLKKRGNNNDDVEQNRNPGVG